MSSSLLSLGDQEPSLFDEFTLEFTASDAAPDSTPLAPDTTHPLCIDTAAEAAMHSFLIDNPERPEEEEQLHRNNNINNNINNNKKKSLDEASSLVSVVDDNELFSPLGINSTSNLKTIAVSQSTERDQYNYGYNHHHSKPEQNMDINTMNMNMNMNMKLNMNMNMNMNIAPSDGHPLQTPTLHPSSNDPQAIFFGQPESLSERTPRRTPISRPIPIPDPTVHPTVTNSSSYVKKFEAMPVSKFEAMPMSMSWPNISYSSTTPPPPIDLSTSMFGGISSGPTMFHQPPIGTAPSIPSTTISSTGLGSADNMNINIGNINGVNVDTMNASSDVFPTGLETPECALCEKIFPDMGALKSHRRKEHPKPKKYPCNIAGCRVKFSAKCNLSKHVKSVHQKQRPHICGVTLCKRAFSERNKLLKHEETVHNGLRPYRCEWDGCNAEFGQKSDRTRHINVVHKGERRYQCRNCKSFGRKSSLAQHLLRVHGIRQNAVNALIQLAQEKLSQGEERLVVLAPPRSSGSAA